MISMVFSGRNDTHGGDFAGRCLRALEYNLKYLDEYGVDYEMVFVEWNPDPDRDTLSSKIAPKVKCFVVDPLIHQMISGNRYIQFFEYFAKNIGASRSNGDFVLFTNAEIMFSKKTLEWLAQGNFEQDVLYRALRTDIIPLDELKARGVDLDNISPQVLENQGFWRITHESKEPPYTNASGDFSMCHRSIVEEFGGYDESIRFSTTHNDSRFAKRVYGKYRRCEIIGGVFHVDHDRPVTGATSRLGLNWVYSRSNDYVNGPQWGLRDISYDEPMAPNVVAVKLNTDLIEEAENREIPEPVLPPQFS
jgi:hypothetical protein